MTSRVIEFRILGAVFLLLTAIFTAFPGLDLAVSGYFFSPETGWHSPAETGFHNATYRGFPGFGRLMLLLILALFALSFVKALTRIKARRALFGFLLAGALLGPVLLVDYTLKGHFGRARPGQVLEFGGTRSFTPAFIPSNQCADNCSFVSGHVSGAAFIMAFGWLGAPLVRRRWLIASVAFAGYFAWLRIAAGGHFLSDTLFAWFATYYCLWLTEWAFRRLKWLP